jgi:hypothetical protein
MDEEEYIYPQRRFSDTEAAHWLRIWSLVTVAGAVIIGVILLAPRFGGATIAQHPKELFNKVVAAAEEQNTEKMRLLLAFGDADLAARKSRKIRTWLLEEANVPEHDLAAAGPVRNLIECLRSGVMQVGTWKYERIKPDAGEDSKTGVILFEDHTSKIRSLPVIRLTEGWRVRLTEFCLEQIREYSILRDKTSSDD